LLAKDRVGAQTPNLATQVEDQIIDITDGAVNETVVTQENLISVTENGDRVSGERSSTAIEERAGAQAKCEGNINLSREIVITKVAIGATLAGSALAAWLLFDLLYTYMSSGIIWNAIAQATFISVVGFLLYGAFVYQFTRLAHLKRQLMHEGASQEELDAFALDRQLPAAVFLIPSYKEEERVVTQALFSVALQEYPNRRVVLLIDDPPDPSSGPDQSSLAATRELTLKIQQIIEFEAHKYEAAYSSYINRRLRGRANDLSREVKILAYLYFQAAQWFQDKALSWVISDHTDRLFVDKILIERSHKYFNIATKIRSSFSHLNEEMIEREYRRLASIFKVELSYFERKRYANLSHESNKAMNLNSYIELMGKSYQEAKHKDGLHLEPSSATDGVLHISDAKYVITLDADSLLLSDYALRLIYTLEQPHSDRIAVIQTPYSAVPNPSSIVERIAGATTDIQHIIHQGFTGFNGTYWVGANAVLRKTALNDIRVVENENGFPIARYIQDRTVIEDTESTVDLIAMGWKLYNYPERLSYSATPPDFGSLLIQRRRWANGGLIILPKLIRYLVRRPFSRNKVGEALMRIHYLTSIATVNFGLLFLIAYPLDAGNISLLLPLACLPYFYLYGRDLILIGYRPLDLLRVYALNLMLLPVNLGGIMKSLQQMIYKYKIPFGRTPKIHGRTGVPVLYLAAIYGLLLLCISAFTRDILDAKYPHAAFCMINAMFFSYVVIRFIGLRNAVNDFIHSGYIRWLNAKWATLRKRVRYNPLLSVSRED